MYLKGIERKYLFYFGGTSVINKSLLNLSFSAYRFIFLVSSLAFLFLKFPVSEKKYDIEKTFSPMPF